MIIDLANVGTTAKKIDLTFDPAEIDLEGELVSLSGKIAFGAETQRLDDKAHVHGLINADVSLACTRCLEPIAKRLEIPFHAVFVDANEEYPNAEAEIADDLLDESLVEDGSINVADVVREQILLATPEQVFCDPGCKGLCPQCGANLNLIDCKCADDDIDPRWAALKSLK